MGRWATYRKRGGGARPASLPPPPTPVFWQEETLIKISPESPSNTDGSWLLYRSLSPEGPFALDETIPWQAGTWQRGATEYYGYYLYVVERGGGVEYFGDSPPTETIKVEEPE